MYPHRNKQPAQVIAPQSLVFVGSLTARAEDALAGSKKREFPSLEFVRAGSFDFCLTHEYERSWPCALRMKVGSLYEAKYWEAPTAQAEVATLPRDVIAPDSLTFFGLARELKGRDKGDARRKLDGLVGVWTDGVMLHTPAGKSDSLQPGKVYCVTVTLLDAAPRA